MLSWARPRLCILQLRPGHHMAMPSASRSNRWPGLHGCGQPPGVTTLGTATNQQPMTQPIQRSMAVPCSNRTFQTCSQICSSQSEHCAILAMVVFYKGLESSPLNQVFGTLLSLVNLGLAREAADSLERPSSVLRPGMPTRPSSSVDRNCASLSFFVILNKGQQEVGQVSRRI